MDVLNDSGRSESFAVKGVISDMDGVILDTEKLYMRFWCDAARSYGYPMEKSHVLSIRSLAPEFAEARLKGIFGDGFDYREVRKKRVELMDEYVEKNGVESKPGAKELLSYLRKAGIKIALATATPPPRTESFLKSLGLYDYFDEIVCASMVKQGKPMPDIYLCAAEKIGLKPCECIALEDSPNGALAAIRAGCRTVFVPDMDEASGEIVPLLYGVARDLTYVKRFL